MTACTAACPAVECTQNVLWETLDVAYEMQQRGILQETAMQF